MSDSWKNKAEHYEVIAFVLKINLSIVLMIDFLYFFLKFLSQYAFGIASTIIESMVVYFPLVMIMCAVLLFGHRGRIKKASLYARSIMDKEVLLRYPRYILFVVMIPSAILFKLSFMLYSKIIGGTATSEVEILILWIFSMFSVLAVYRKIFPFIYESSGDSSGDICGRPL